MPHAQPGAVARCAVGCASGPASPLTWIGALVAIHVSGKRGVPRLPGAGELHRQCFASVSQCAVAQTWIRAVRGVCSVRPLRPPASLLHNALFCEAPGSHYAKATFCAERRLRALSGSQKRRYAKCPTLGPGASAVGASRSLRALHAGVCAPFALARLLGISQALRAVFYASGLRPGATCVAPPAHPWALPLRGTGPRAAGPSAPPRGAPCRCAVNRGRPCCGCAAASVDQVGVAHAT